MANFNNSGSDTLITGTNGDDLIENHGSNVSILAGAGKDRVKNYGDSVAMSGEDGNDILISGEFFIKGGKSLTISGGAGNDTITSSGSNSVLDGGAGNDLIHNGYYYFEDWNAYYDSSSDGKYDDDNKSARTTIASGAGNDSIYNRGAIVSISAGTGNNLVENFGDKVTITSAKDKDSIRNEGASVLISAGTGDDFVENNGGQKVKIDGGTGNDTIRNSIRNAYNFDTKKWEFVSSPDNVTINAGAGNDYIFNDGARISISGGAGNDSIDNSGDNVTINAGAGNDSIYSSGENVLVLVNGGQNTVEGNVTINTGAGNTTLTGDRNVQVYQYGGGNNFITNYSHEDIIHIASGKLDSYSFDGGDLIFHIGDGSIRLKNMINHAITLKDSSGKTSTKIYGTGYSGHEVIKNFVQSTARTALPDAGLKIDEAIKACSHFNSLEDVVNQMVADCRTAGNAEIFLRDYCGIILDNDDSGAPTGWDAGGLISKTIKDLIPETGEASYPESTTFIKHGVTVTVPEKNTLNEKEQLVVRGFYSWWAESAFKLIEKTYGISLNGYSVELKFSYEPDAGYWATGGTVVTVNMAHTQGITETDNVGVDGMFSHELTHFMQAVFGHLGYMYSMYPYMIEGMANLTGGSGGTFASAGNPEQLAEDLALVDNKGNDSYETGYMFWRYLMKQASDSYDSLKSYAWKDGSSIVGINKSEFLTAGGKNQTIMAGAGNDTITVYGEKMKVLGATGNDYILIGSVASSASIDGGAGNDSIHNYGNKITISAGSGNDSIENYGVKVSISAGAGNDSIENHGSQVSISTGTGDDSIENYGDNTTINGSEGNDSITNDGGQKVKIDGGEGNNYIHNNVHNEYNWDANKWETVSSPDNVTINAGTGNDTIENYGVKISISAGAGDDSITNHAEGSNSTLDGGDGNDRINNWAGEIWNEETQKYDINPSPDNTKMFGKDGNDTLYNEGSTILMDGGTADDLLINGGYSEWERGGSEVSLLGGAGNDTITSHGSKCVLNGGNGADSIYNGYRYYETWNAFYDSDDENYKGNNSTISGGAGDDSIKNCGSNVLFKYTSGDGDDTILGFNATSTLSVSGDAYSTQTSNSDIIVTVGKGKITLQGGARLATVNIDGKEKDYWTINGSTATYGTTSNTLITIDGVANGATAANFYVKGNTVTIGKAAVKTDGTPVKLLTDGYTLKLGKGMTAPVTSTKATLKTGKYTFSDVTASGYNLADNSITYVAGSTTNKLELKGIATKPSAPKNDIVTLKLANFSDNLSVVSNSGGYKFSIAKGTYNDKIFTGSKGADTIKSAAASLKINAGKGNDSITSSGANVSINAGAGNDYILSTGKNVTINGGAGNDSLWGSSYADNFIYSSGDGKDIIFGFDDNDTLTLDSLDFKASYSKSKDAVTLKFDSNNTITFKDFTATTFHINNDVYKISGSKLKKQ